MLFIFIFQLNTTRTHGNSAGFWNAIYNLRPDVRKWTKRESGYYDPSVHSIVGK